MARAIDTVVESVDADDSLTVSAVARRLGVAPATLRTWDRRYGIGPSQHDSGTHRRYSATDVMRLTAMARLIVAGVTPKDAASKALALNAKGTKNKVEKVLQESEAKCDLVSLLYKSALKFDQANIEKLLKKSIAEKGIEKTWTEVIAPLLTDVGNDWARTGIGIETEHFLSEVLRKILSENLGRIENPRSARPVLLACVENEYHSLALAVLAAVLAESGIRCIYLGARTPQSALNEVIIKSAPPAIFLWAQLSENADHNYVKSLPVIRPAPRILLGGPGWESTKVKLTNKLVITKGLSDAREQIMQAIAV
ncbi:MAG: MerR family transcriptional regulator [Actinobacteria bacterium]|jgi:MerR family transcriptional regulator, light-induced transcriptional regulator|nr:MerR family transcriptional regulator [Actinomycetota bacterium]MDA2982109.1 MerR family transcriptional regulator [Actinomycetota bacterium]MDA2996049.1 MerR family transcriptional regulator [Actinomycetota bacterium]